MRKAQGIGINVVIIAAIALLVLIIIAVIVSQGGSSLQEGLNRCPVLGGQCSTTSPTPFEDYRINDDGTCPEPSQTCYVPA